MKRFVYILAIMMFAPQGLAVVIKKPGVSRPMVEDGDTIFHQQQAGEQGTAGQQHLADPG